jgi:hypothetical protein
MNYEDISEWIEIFSKRSELARMNRGVASILYALAGHGDLFVQDRDKCNHIVLAKYTDYEWPFYLMTSGKYILSPNLSGEGGINGLCARN